MLELITIGSCPGFFDWPKTPPKQTPLQIAKVWPPGRQFNLFVVIFFTLRYN